MAQIRRILLASSNEHKRHEFSQLFKDYEILLPSDLGLSFDCEENGETFLDNALIKANALYEVAKDLRLPVMADDSGLIVPALPGLLGVRTARFGSVDGGPLLSAHEKNQLLIKMLEGKPEDDRKAVFVCAIVMILDKIGYTVLWRMPLAGSCMRKQTEPEDSDMIRSSIAMRQVVPWLFCRMETRTCTATGAKPQEAYSS